MTLPRGYACLDGCAGARFELLSNPLRDAPTLCPAVRPTPTAVAPQSSWHHHTPDRSPLRTPPPGNLTRLRSVALMPLLVPIPLCRWEKFWSPLLGECAVRSRATTSKHKRETNNYQRRSPDSVINSTSSSSAAPNERLSSKNRGPLPILDLGFSYYLRPWFFCDVWPKPLIPYSAFGRKAWQVLDRIL